MANRVRMLVDSFRNLVANLNTSRDKQAAGDYYLMPFSPAALSTLYRVSWLGKKAVDIPANDATREWREWRADQSQIEDIEVLEKDLLLKQKVRRALKMARLYGGSGLYFSIRGDDPEEALDLESVSKDSLAYVTVLSRSVLNAGPRVTDPLLEGYGYPEYYTLSSESEGQVRLHASRVAVFYGNEILDPSVDVGADDGWSDSILQCCYEAVRNADATAANIASLVYEAKVDVLQIPELDELMADDRSRNLLEQRIILAATLKGNNGLLVIDKEEEHTQKTFNFTGLPDINHQALQAVSGAADIPITRFLGQSPSGMNSTGESDLKNYYDAVGGTQRLVISPALKNLDEVLIRSALGDRPDDIDYVWASLWQMSDTEKSKISKETAETIKTLVETALFNEEDLAKAAVNMLVEHSIMPTLEYSEPPDEDEPALPGEEDDDDLAEQGTVDATTPRTLYISRAVLNTGDFTAWARTQGITSMIPANQLHVTVAYSRTPIDWTEIGADWSSDEDGKLRVKPGGPRVIESFGEGAKVLAFSDQSLKYRHASILRKGASWDYEDYTPHITITYGELPEGVQPYEGPIVLGPERFREVEPFKKDTGESA